MNLKTTLHSIRMNKRIINAILTLVVAALLNSCAVSPTGRQQMLLLPDGTNEPDGRTGFCRDER